MKAYYIQIGPNFSRKVVLFLERTFHCVLLFLNSMYYCECLAGVL